MLRRFLRRWQKSPSNPTSDDVVTQFHQQLLADGVPKDKLNWAPLTLGGVRGPYIHGLKDCRADLVSDPSRHGYTDRLHVACYILGWAEGAK